MRKIAFSGAPLGAALAKPVSKVLGAGVGTGRVVGAVAGGALGAASAPKDGTATTGGTVARIAGGALLGGAAGGHIGGAVGSAAGAAKKGITQIGREGLGAPPIPQAAAKPGQVLSQSHLPMVDSQHVRSYAPPPPPRAAAPVAAAASTAPNAIAYDQLAGPQAIRGAAPSNAGMLEPPVPVNKPWFRRGAKVDQVTADTFGSGQTKLNMARIGTMNSAMINGFSDELQQIHKVANFGEQPLRKGLNFASQVSRKASTAVPKGAHEIENALKRSANVAEGAANKLPSPEQLNPRVFGTIAHPTAFT